MEFLRSLYNRFTGANKIVLDLKQRAEEGQKDAQWQLGKRYFYGKGVKKDLAEGARWFLKAAEQCHGDAQLCLGACYARGQGVPINVAEGYKWIFLASEQKVEGAEKLLKMIGVAMKPEEEKEGRERAHAFWRNFYEGGDGTSEANAVIVRHSNSYDLNGIARDHWLENRFGRKDTDWTDGSVYYLTGKEDPSRRYTMHTITTLKDGKRTDIFFRDTLGEKAAQRDALRKKFSRL